MKNKMDCIECDYLHKFKGRRIVYKYKASGLDNIRLSGVIEYKCPRCHAVYLEIPEIPQLHGLIADMILRLERQLTGKEVRFLRKQLGYSAEQFGKLISYDPKTLSRIENGRQKVTPTFDRLIRMAYATGKRDLDYDLHDLLLGQGIKYRRLELAYSAARDWKVSKSAA